MDASPADKEHERQPLQAEETEQADPNGTDTSTQNASQDPNLTAQSLIRHTDDTQEGDLVSPYSVDPTMITNAYENPYKETTSAQSFIRRVPSSDLVPAPFTKFKHVMLLSVIAMASFLFTGFFAFRLAKNAKKQHSKGLYGLAQRDSKKSVILSYLSITLGILLTILVIVLIATT